MLNFKLLYCKTRMVAYLNGELSVDAQRKVGRYIDECPACYAEYLRQRELKRYLSVSVPSIGKANPQQINQIWQGIQTQLQQPIQSPNYLRHIIQISVGGMLSICMLFVLMMFDRGDVRADVMLPAIPQVTEVANMTLTLSMETASATPTETAYSQQDSYFTGITPDAALMLDEHS
jgi:predicted RNA-binding protein YlxR (DUF448 family)